MALNRTITKGPNGLFQKNMGGKNKKNQTKMMEQDIQTKFRQACISNDLASIKLLLASKANVNHKSPAGSTPLMEATTLGHTSVIKKLIKHGADVNAVNRQSNTALHFAYEKHHYDIIRFLEGHGAAPSHDITNAAGHTPRKYMYAKVPLDRKLKIACQHGDLRNAEFFLLQGASVDAATVAGSTALMDAVWYGHSHIINFLLKNGARMDKVTQTGNTALHMAYMRGHKSVVEVLLHHGANPNVKNTKGLTASDMLYVKGSDNYKLRLACRYGHTRKMAMLLKQGAKIDSASSRSGMTGLMDAVWNRHAEAVTLLVKCGADLTLRNQRKNNALHLAYQHLDERIIKILSRSPGFDKALKQHNYLRLTPRQLGKRVERGGGAKRVYSEALGKAAKGGNAYLVADMIKGVDVNAQSESGKTVLMDAVNQGHLEVSQVLVRAKADVNITTFQNKTALQFAIERNHTECAAYLKGVGAVLEPKVQSPKHQHRPKQPDTPKNHKIQKMKSRLNAISDSGAMSLKATLMIEEADSLWGDVTVTPSSKGHGALKPLAPLSRDAVLDSYIKSKSQIEAEREAAEAKEREQKARVRRNERQRDGLNKKRKPMWKIKQEQNGGKPLPQVVKPVLSATADPILDKPSSTDASAKDKADKEKRKRDKKERRRRRKAARAAHRALVHKLRKTTLDVVHCASVLRAALMHRRRRATADKQRVQAQQSPKTVRGQALALLADICATAQRTVDGGAKVTEEVDPFLSQTATKIQSIWRGKLDRQYTQVKRMFSHPEAAKHDAIPHQELTHAQKLEMDRLAFERQEQALELLTAATDGDAELVQALLEAGADPNPKDTDGYTPLLLSAYYGDDRTVKVLLENGADPALTTLDGTTALAVAALTGASKVVSTLLDFSPQTLDVPVGDGSTPLLLAAQEGNTDVVSLLVKRKADINARNKNDGRTALLIAVQEDHLEAVSCLLAAGADPTIMTSTDPPSAVLEIAKSSTMMALLEPIITGGDTKVDYSPFESFIWSHIKVSNSPTMTVPECSELLERLAGEKASGRVPEEKTDTLSFVLFCGLCKLYSWTNEVKDELRNWEAQQDCGRMFFYNHLTEQSQWEDPFCLKACEWERMQQSGQVFYYNHTTGESVWDQPADYFETAATTINTEVAAHEDEGDDEWEEIQDYDSVYYVNKITGETVFEKPEDFGKKKEKTAQVTQERQHDKSQMISTAKFLNAHAKEALAEVGADGDPEDEEEWVPREEWGELFYQHSLTGEIKWPKALPSTWRVYEEKSVTYYGDEETGTVWQLKFTEHKRPFFRNTANGACLWSPPWVASKTKSTAPWAVMWIKKMLLSD